MFLSAFCMIISDNIAIFSSILNKNCARRVYIFAVFSCLYMVFIEHFAHDGQNSIITGACLQQKRGCRP